MSITPGRVIAILAICGLSMHLAGCGGSASTTTSAPSQQQTDAQQATADYYKANPPNKKAGRQR